MGPGTTQCCNFSPPHPTYGTTYSDVPTAAGSAVWQSGAAVSTMSTTTAAAAEDRIVQSSQVHTAAPSGSTHVVAAIAMALFLRRLVVERLVELVIS